VQVAIGSSEFPLVIVLPSSASAIAYPILFGTFFGNMLMSDFSAAFMPGLRLQTFPGRSNCDQWIPLRSPGSRA
jgi:hypothetical protein